MLKNKRYFKCNTISYTNYSWDQANYIRYNFKQSYTN